MTDILIICCLQSNLLFSDGVDLEKEKEPQPSTSTSLMTRAALEIDAPIRDDGFGGNLGQDIIGTCFKVISRDRYFLC